MERVEVGHYLDSGQHFGSATAARIHQLIRDRGIAYHTVAAGDSILGFGEASAVVLHPRPGFVNLNGEAPDGLNNGSVVVKITFQKESFLLTGDIEHETDSALLAWGERLHSSILKAPHHGSRTSSTRRFLEAVSPRWVAISCGIENKFGHPSPEVVSRYQKLNIKSRRTDLGGCLTFRIGEDGIGVSRFLEGRANRKRPAAEATGLK
jgi:competence protein ComEC